MFYGLELHNVRKSFSGNPVVNDVSLTVPQGQFVCFLGPSGCGKTTLLRMIAGLEETTGGKILLNGKDVTKIPVHQRNFAMVFQSLALYPHLSVSENISYSLKLRGRSKDECHNKSNELLELIQLPGIGQRKVDQLSGGQRQRVAIARALAQEPLLFLMDEPLSALDAKLRDHMQVELRQLQQKLKITTIFVTHDQREAMSIADTIVIMGDGVIQQVGSPQEVYRHPANRFVANFIGQSNLFPATVISDHVLELMGQKIECNPVSPAYQSGDACSYSVRPEDIVLSDAQHGWLAKVTFLRDMGATREIHLLAENGMEVIMTSQNATQLKLGDMTYFSLRPFSGVVLEPESSHA